MADLKRAADKMLIITTTDFYGDPISVISK
jgi:hypothetical protein